MDEGEELPTRVGEVLAGKYLLEKRLGAGGLGTVYEAENRILGRPVAIKVLHPELARTPDLVRRFLAAARAAMDMRHLHLADVIDVGQDDAGAPYFVQELLVGEDLAAAIARRGALPPNQVVAIVLPIVLALAQAHERGLLHRDVKPRNLFLQRAPAERSGVRPKLLDFGLSRFALDPGAVRTGAAMSLGNAAYMAPEQILGKDVNARSDVWSVGVLLFEALTAQLPFEADAAAGYMMTAATQPPRVVATLAPTVPALLAAIVGRCLSTAPKERYRDGGALAVALKEAALALPPVLPSAPPPAPSTPPPLPRSEPKAKAFSVSDLPALDLDEGSSARAERGVSAQAPSVGGKAPGSVPPLPDAGAVPLELAVDLRDASQRYVPSVRHRPDLGPGPVERGAARIGFGVLGFLKGLALLVLIVVGAHGAEALGLVSLPFRIDALTSALRSLGLGR